MTVPTWLLLALLWLPLAATAGALWWWAVNTHNDSDTLEQHRHERAALGRACQRDRT